MEAIRFALVSASGIAIPTALFAAPWLAAAANQLATGKGTLAASAALGFADMHNMTQRATALLNANAALAADATASEP